MSSFGVYTTRAPRWGSQCPLELVFRPRARDPNCLLLRVADLFPSLLSRAVRYREWIGLIDRTGEHQGVVGYVQLSVVVLGPHDWAPVHDRKREIATQKRKADKIAKEKMKKGKSKGPEPKKMDRGKSGGGCCGGKKPPPIAGGSGEAPIKGAKAIPDGQGADILVAMPKIEKEVPPPPPPLSLLLSPTLFFSS